MSNILPFKLYVVNKQILFNGELLYPNNIICITDVYGYSHRHAVYKHTNNKYIGHILNSELKEAIKNNLISVNKDNN